MEPIVTYKERCRRCYSCVRSCPVKAIKVDGGYAQIMHDRCIGCGNCLSCPQQAKVVVDRMVKTQEMLASGSPVVAVLGCSFPAFFYKLLPGQLVAALKSLGFCEVHEGAYGATMIADSYQSALKSSDRPLISSHCSAVVDLVERHYPSLVPNIMPIASPMVATGRFIKSVLGNEARVVYVSSCIAAKFEMQEDASGAIDVVLTYQEIDKLFKNRGITPASLAEAPFDGLNPGDCRLFSLTGGTLRAFGITTDFQDNDTICAEGELHTIGIIRDLAARRISPAFVDLRFCDGGCVDGPFRDKEMNHFYKRKLIIGHNSSQLPYKTAGHYRSLTTVPDLTRTFSDKSVKLPVPGKDDVKRVLQSTNKYSHGDELNCRACGYNTCREHAVAVFQGLADIQMCLPHSMQRIVEERGSLLQKYELVQRELDRQAGEDLIVGRDPGIREVMELIHQVGPTPTTVLIRGETGTGKELTARGIHRNSQRNDKPLMTVNCTTLTDSLLESELFGHKKGSFTGAIADKKGLFEAADGGTIFLDEIGDITPKLQAELLRILDMGEVRPVGSVSAKKIDVRLIAATNKDLELGVREGWFREDLYYRLNVFCIELPPLRNRPESVPDLAQHFLEKARKKLNKTIAGIEDRAVKAMQHYQWPGNIREMQNVIERSAVLVKDGIIRLENLPTVFTDTYESCLDVDVNRRRTSFKAEREQQVGRTEKHIIARYLEESRGNVAQAARLANVPRRSFYRLLEKHGIEVVRSHTPRISSVNLAKPA
ncbi:MAG: sigma 54-interacting transcriptional regulator [Desulfuromonadaceae bacterium]|nr:sigma 54-interacting transcriptional regulator [Desulfuromonadaceae bacterium]MDD5103983.1 sigma 54-interacting transcriptional regulator [Desulfuromonadaceae bacterium]